MYFVCCIFYICILCMYFVCCIYVCILLVVYMSVCLLFDFNDMTQWCNLNCL